MDLCKNFHFAHTSVSFPKQCRGTIWAFVGPSVMPSITYKLTNWAPMATLARLGEFLIAGFNPDPVDKLSAQIGSRTVTRNTATASSPPPRFFSNRPATQRAAHPALTVMMHGVCASNCPMDTSPSPHSAGVLNPGTSGEDRHAAPWHEMTHTIL